MAKANVKGLLPAEPDMVNSPPHYCIGQYEVADVLDEWFATDPHCWQAVKYIARHMLKGRPVMDLEKAIWFIKRRVSVLQKGGDDAGR